jgi:hypothetical protein
LQPERFPRAFVELWNIDDRALWGQSLQGLRKGRQRLDIRAGSDNKWDRAMSGKTNMSIKTIEVRRLPNVGGPRCAHDAKLPPDHVSSSQSRLDRRRDH